MTTDFKPDAQLEGLIVDPSRGYRTGTYLERPDPPACIVVHTTGAGPLRRFANAAQRARHGWETTFDAGRWIYRTRMTAGPHYVQGQAGQRAQVCPESLAAWHVGSRGSGHYTRPDGTWARRGKETWWLDRWKPYGLTSPFELAGGNAWTLPRSTKPFRMGVRTGFAKHSCNDNSIGIEVLPPLHSPRGSWSLTCWVSLAELILEIANRRNIPLDPRFIFTHSDAHPRSRSSRNAPWDTVPGQWSFERFAEIAGVTRITA